MNYLINNSIQDCLFFGDPYLEKYVIKQGYKYISYGNEEVINLLKYREKKQKAKSEHVYKKLHGELAEIIEKYDVEEMYCDISRYMFFAPVGYLKNIKVNVFWTYNGPTHFNLAAYPQSVSRVTETKLGCLIAWIKQFYYGEIKSKKICFYLTYPYKIFLHPRFWGKMRYSMDGFFVNTQKIICGPKEFTKYYDKKTVFDMPKTVFSINEKNKLMDNLIEEVKSKIYITFGTQNDRYADGIEVIQHILECIKNRKDIGVIVNLGKYDRCMFPGTYNNVYFVSEINQDFVLSKVDLVIFHGGYGTLKESYYHKKRMVVIPFMYDQFANARLVEEKGLGIYLSVKKALKTDFSKLFE